MDVLTRYGSSDDDMSDAAPETSGPLLKRLRVDAAPEVAVEDIASNRHLVSTGQKELKHNIPYEDLSRAVLGPENPFKSEAEKMRGNTVNGSYESTQLSDHIFLAQQRTYMSFGYAVDPTAILDGAEERYVGDVVKANALEGADVYQSIKKDTLQKAREWDVAVKDAEKLREMARQSEGVGVPASVSLPQPVDPVAAAAKRKRKERGDPGDVEGYLGPWAGYEGETYRAPIGPTPDEVALAEALSDGKARPSRKELWEKRRAEAGAEAELEEGNEKTTFHGKEERDYLGRTYMAVPKDQGIDLMGDPGSQECFLPKKVIHTWTGHTKGVNAIRFFPNSGHMLLSCSMDGKVKLWDCYNDRRCLRTYMGHAKGVRDIWFNNEGTKFLTASYDRWIKLWDTETGKCIQRISGPRIPYCVRFHPKEQNIILAGCSDKKIMQYDLNALDPNTGAPTIIQEYDQHLGPVNSVTFVEDGRRFVSTSDDKTLRVWETGIPVVIKYVAEPTMHSMPAVTVSPNKKWLACTSLDNQIQIYSARDRFSLNRKKRFAGHVVAGYACQPAFSADGRFILSGDGEGKVWAWDWKTTKILKKWRAHEQVVMGVEWHPHETSKVATCSWDGTIKYWD